MGQTPGWDRPGSDPEPQGPGHAPTGPPQFGYGPAEGGAGPGWAGQPGWPGHGGQGTAPGGAGGHGRDPRVTAAARPGIVPLRPLALGEIFDGAFQAIRANPRVMVGVSAVVIAAVSLITVVPQAFAMRAYLGGLPTGQAAVQDLVGPVAGLLSVSLVLAVSQGLAVTIVSGLLMVAVSRAVLGQHVTLGDLWRLVRRRVPALLGLTLLTAVIYTLVFVVLLLPALGLALVHAEVVAALLAVLGALVALAVDAVLALGWFALAAPALLLERTSIRGALRRSVGLVRRSFWRVFGIMLLTSVITSVVVGIVSAPASAIGAVLLGSSPDAPPGMVASLLSSLADNLGVVVAGVLVYPFTAAVTALLYIDLRMRREGLDVELLRAAQDRPAW